jgi:hypothetical protein
MIARLSDPAASDPDVFFYDDFESGDLGAWDDRYDDRANPNVSVVSEPEHVFAGSHALEIAVPQWKADTTAPPGKASGASLPIYFMPGYDTVHARWYCKFAADFDQGENMHFVRLVGGPPDDYEAAFNRAGTRPTGADFFTTGIDPWLQGGEHPAPGALTFYTYYPDMESHADGNYWGSFFRTDPPFVVERCRWYCMEMMVKCNTVGCTDGEQAAWVDGSEVVRVTGLRWREVHSLKVHCFRLHLYLHHSPHINRVWFDNIALSTGYIGLIPPAT